MPTLLTAADAAAALRVSEEQLAIWRWEGYGPPAVRAADGTYRYAAAVVADFLGGGR